MVVGKSKKVILVSQDEGLMKNYIQSIEMTANAEGNMDDELRAWIEWARRKVAAYNPIRDFLRDEVIAFNPDERS